MKTLTLPQSISPDAFDYWTHISFTRPRSDCLYIQVLKALSAGEELTTRELIGRIKGDLAHIYMTGGYVHNHSVIASLRSAGYIFREKKGWVITDKGKKYLQFTGL